METTINTAKELKAFVKKHREIITDINGVSFGKMYPILDVSNSHATYYDPTEQGNKFLLPPFVVTTQDE
jgi:hypothetical protein